MDVEVITIGDEVITGHTVDTNSAFIARALTDIGLSLKYKTSVGDSIEQMEEAFRIALKRTQIIITTGGLGPTDDDLTKRAIVKVFKRNLIFHEEILEDLKKRYRGRGIEMPAINQNQALLPQGARFFPNKLGSAVGICIAEEGRIFIALPGVPSEMKHLMIDEVLPYLKSLRTGQTLKVIKLRTTGIIESALAELIMPHLRLEPGVRLAYLPGYGGVDLRILASGADEEEAQTKAATLAKLLESHVGKYIYGRDDDSLEGIIGKLVVERGHTLAVAESCTGGQVGMLITSVAGSSDYFLGGLIAYSNDVKVQKLGISQEILKAHGAVSAECATAMASGARELFGATYALSVTGVAGPGGGTEQKPVGTTFIGVASPQRAHARKFQLGVDREINRTRAAYSALEMLRREILDIK